MTKQLSLADAFVSPALGRNAKLERIAALIDWSQLEPVARRIRSGETGRPPYAALAMLKALYLQAMYDLSDPGLEEALLDRISFRRFCAFALDAATPDETTICRFRQEAAAAGLLAEAFAVINAQLEAKGLMLKKGTLMDATLIAAKHAPPKVSRPADLGARHAEEPEADWTRKGGKAFFGYKAHIGADAGSGLVRTVVYTSAKVFESEVADHLISGDEAAVYADKAYELKARRRRLKAAGIKDRIMHRGHKHMARLPRWQEARNRLIARRRAPIEAVFSAGKRLYGLGRARYANLVRNAARALAVFTIYNLRRATIIEAR
jgi:transposase, IS5 family